MGGLLLEEDVEDGVGDDDGDGNAPTNRPEHCASPMQPDHVCDNHNS